MFGSLKGKGTRGRVCILCVPYKQESIPFRVHAPRSVFASMDASHASHASNALTALNALNALSAESAAAGSNRSSVSSIPSIPSLETGSPSADLVAVITRGMPKSNPKMKESIPSFSRDRVMDLTGILNPDNLLGLSYLKTQAEKRMTEDELERTMAAMAMARARYEARAEAVMDVLDEELMARKCAHAQLVVLIHTFSYFTKAEDLQTLIEALDVPLGKSMVLILQGERMQCECTADTEVFFLHYGCLLREIERKLLRASRDRHVRRAFLGGRWDVAKLLFLFESVYHGDGDGDGQAFCEDVEAVCRAQLEACGSNRAIRVSVQGALLSGLMDFKNVLLLQKKSDGMALFLDKLDALLGKLRGDF